MSPKRNIVLQVIFGDDEFRASEVLRALKAAIDTDGSLATNTNVLPARGLTPQTLIQNAAAMPFLSPARLVIVEGLLSSLGSRRGVVEAWQQVVDFIPQMPDCNHLVFLEPPRKRDDRGRGVGGSPLLAAFRAAAPDAVTVTELNELKTWARGGPSEVVRWLQDRAIARGISIDPRAIEALADLVGANLRALASELDKLAMYAGDRPITADDVRLLTPQAREESIFALVDSVVEARTADALRLLRRMREEESEDSLRLLGMVARQLRMMVRAAELIEAHAPPEAISSATGARGFPLEKLMRQARAAGRTASEASLRAAEQADHSVKTGRLDKDLALELLVVRLADLAPRGARARR